LAHYPFWLRPWHFGDAMTEVVKHANNFSYSHEGGAGLIDLVQAAILQIEENKEQIENTKQSLLV